MLKELQEKLLLEMQRLQKDLATKIKEALNEEKVYAQIADDLSTLVVHIIKDSENEQTVSQSHYSFNYSVDKENKLSKVYGAESNILVVRDKKIVGSYSTPTLIPADLIQFVFSVIEQFRTEELAKQEAPKEAESVEAAPAE